MSSKYLRNNQVKGSWRVVVNNSPNHIVHTRTLDQMFEKYSVMETIQTTYNDARGEDWYDHHHYHRDSLFRGPPYIGPARSVLGFPATGENTASSSEDDDTGIVITYQN